jgi:hypothetical protein
MGHANASNLAKLALRQLYARGKVTIAELTEVAVKREEVFHTSEGSYTDPHMLSYGFEEVFSFWLNQRMGGVPAPVVIPVEMAHIQEKILDQWGTDAFVDWDCGDDGRGGEYSILDSIQWVFGDGWRRKYPDIPILEEFSN